VELVVFLCKAFKFPGRCSFKNIEKEILFSQFILKKSKVTDFRSRPGISDPMWSISQLAIKGTPRWTNRQKNSLNV